MSEFGDSKAAPVDTADATVRVLREIQRELADMRDDRTVMVAILNRLDASVNSLGAELRALRSQFDRFRNEVRDQLRQPGGA